MEAVHVRKIFPDRNWRIFPDRNWKIFPGKLVVTDGDHPAFQDMLDFL